jgi:carbohydrate-binding DOMON domain-containing protein
MFNTKLNIQQIEARGDVEGYTAYQIWRILSAAITAEGLLTAKGVPAWTRPQMVYNYNRNGMVVQGQKNVDRFTRNQVEAFVTKQLTKLRELPINGTTKIETESKDTAEMQSASRG